MLQAVLDLQIKVANHTSVLQIYFNCKQSSREPKKIISLIVSVNTDLINTSCENGAVSSPVVSQISMSASFFEREVTGEMLGLFI